ncbi:MAG: TMEM14 family protein [Chthoniobacterales bacterium]
MKFLGRWFIVFGAFLIICGAAGYLSNPSAAKTALISGGTFGSLSCLWGCMMLRGSGWSRWAGLATTLLLLGAFSWRAWAGWKAFAMGEPKLFAASLITLMLVATLATLVELVSDMRSRSWATPPPR